MEREVIPPDIARSGRIIDEAIKDLSEFEKEILPAVNIVQKGLATWTEIQTILSVSDVLLLNKLSGKLAEIDYKITEAKHKTEY